MAIAAEDINLGNFLNKFTLQSDPTPQGKIVLSDADFVKTAAILKLELQIQRLVQK